LTNGRDGALKHAIYNAQKKSRDTCYRCGFSVSETEWGEHQKLIERFCFDEQVSENKFQFMKVCLNCLESKYSVSELDKIEALTIEDNVEETVIYDTFTDTVQIDADDEIVDMQKNVGDSIIDSGEKNNLIAIYQVSDVDKLEIEYKGASREQASRVNNSLMLRTLMIFPLK
jgi:hypothetical protein